MTRFKPGDRVAFGGKTYKITRVSPGGHKIVAVHGRGDNKTQHSFDVNDVTKASVA